MTRRCDILVVGGGLAGRIATLALARQGFGVCCVDPAPPARSADNRTTAFLQSAWPALDMAGLLDTCRDMGAALDVMRIVDASTTPHATAEFRAQEISDGPFGINIVNAELLSHTDTTLTAQQNATLITGRSLAALHLRDDAAFATLDDRTRVRAALVVGADGRNSAVRSLAGITTRRHVWAQSALSFMVTHAAPHDNISTEVHRHGGPFTLVPMPDTTQGAHRSAVVWMMPDTDVDAHLEMDDPTFSAAATERSAGVLGALTVMGPRGRWPMLNMAADQLVSRRIALIAEAAHVVPPIGAQGLNMSLADLAALAQAIGSGDPGRPEALRAYQSARLAEIRARVAGIAALNRASIAGSPTVTDLRAKAIAALASSPTARAPLMRAGMGARVLDAFAGSPTDPNAVSR